MSDKVYVVWNRGHLDAICDSLASAMHYIEVVKKTMGEKYARRLYPAKIYLWKHKGRRKSSFKI